MVLTFITFSTFSELRLKKPFYQDRNHMGRNAKFLKKVKKTVSQTSNKPTAASTPGEQKKKAGLRFKVHIRKPGSEGPVLGGADYVSLMMGGRRKAREEAAKLPKDPDA